MILQLNPPLPVVTPKGPGIAHFVLDYGVEHDLMWTVFLTASGECWTYGNKEIRADKNITLGRTLSEPSYAKREVKCKDLVEMSP